MEKNQKIKCDVKSCKYHDSGDCTLDEIKVSSNCDCAKDDVCDCEETICASFKKEKCKKD